MEKHMLVGCKEASARWKLVLDDSHDGDVFHNDMETKESELEDYWLCTGIYCSAMGGTLEDQVNRDRLKGQKAVDSKKIANSQIIAERSSLAR